MTTFLFFSNLTYAVAYMKMTRYVDNVFVDLVFNLTYTVVINYTHMSG